LKYFVIAVIVFYQKYLSPYKGYSCAHAAYYRGDSCSTAISKIIRRQGLIAGWPAIKQQFTRCSHAYERYIEDDRKKKKPKRSKKQGRCERYCDGLPCEIINCLPVKSCKGFDSDACDLPCDCSP